MSKYRPTMSFSDVATDECIQCAISCDLCKYESEIKRSPLARLASTTELPLVTVGNTADSWIRWTCRNVWAQTSSISLATLHGYLKALIHPTIFFRLMLSVDQQYWPMTADFIKPNRPTFLSADFSRPNGTSSSFLGQMSTDIGNASLWLVSWRVGQRSVAQNRPTIVLKFSENVVGAIGRQHLPIKIVYCVTGFRTMHSNHTVAVVPTIESGGKQVNKSQLVAWPQPNSADSAVIQRWSHRSTLRSKYNFYGSLARQFECQCQQRRHSSQWIYTMNTNTVKICMPYATRIIKETLYSSLNIKWVIVVQCNAKDISTSSYFITDLVYCDFHIRVKASCIKWLFNHCVYYIPFPILNNMCIKYTMAGNSMPESVLMHYDARTELK